MKKICFAILALTSQITFSQTIGGNIQLQQFNVTNEYSKSNNDSSYYKLKENMLMYFYGVNYFDETKKNEYRVFIGNYYYKGNRTGKSFFDNKEYTDSITSLNKAFTIGIATLKYCNFNKIQFSAGTKFSCTQFNSNKNETTRYARIYNQTTNSFVENKIAEHKFTRSKYFEYNIGAIIGTYYKLNKFSFGLELNPTLRITNIRGNYSNLNNFYDENGMLQSSKTEVVYQNTFHYQMNFLNPSIIVKMELYHFKKKEVSE